MTTKRTPRSGGVEFAVASSPASDLNAPRVISAPLRDDRYPFLVVRDAVGREPDPALNACVGTTLQLGFIGLGLLLVALGLAFVRSWLVAPVRRAIPPPRDTQTSLEP